MVGILLKIGKQSENVGEEEVFGRFCIRDVAENPSGGRISDGNRALPPAPPPFISTPNQMIYMACSIWRQRRGLNLHLSD